VAEAMACNQKWTAHGDEEVEASQHEITAKYHTITISVIKQVNKTCACTIQQLIFVDSKLQ
jgi:hypothetical protein